MLTSYQVFALANAATSTSQLASHSLVFLGPQQIGRQSRKELASRLLVMGYHTIRSKKRLVHEAKCIRYFDTGVQTQTKHHRLECLVSVSNILIRSAYQNIRC